MKFKKIPYEFRESLIILKKLKKFGYEAYFVGGCIRNLILNKKINDIDITTNAIPIEIKKIFKFTIDLGIKFGTVGILINKTCYEVTTFRKEICYNKFRKPEKIIFVNELKCDLKRRDFTINTLVMDYKGKIFDIFNGIKDLNNRILKTVGNSYKRFYEDALRILRCLRFVSQLNFFIENNTLNSIYKFSYLLKYISIERITIEFQKLLLGINRNYAIYLFVKTNCYLYCPYLKRFKKKIYLFSILNNRKFDCLEQAWVLFIKYLNIKNVYIFLIKWRLSKKNIKKIIFLLKYLYIRFLHKFKKLNLYILKLNNILLIEKIIFYYTSLNSEKNFIKKKYYKLSIYDFKDIRVNGFKLIKKFKLKSNIYLGMLIKNIEIAILYKIVNNNEKELLLYVNKLIKKKE